MRAKGAAIALAILFGGFSLLAQDAAARTTDGRQGKPATRAAAAPAPSAAQGAARPTTRSAANATARGSSQRGHNAGVRTASADRSGAAARNGRRAAARSGGGYSAGISCVPYARQATGMAISGNGGQWWYNAAGLYARGNRPEIGSIMAFPGSGGMRAGHVAVVERVISSREVLIHHANWGGPGIRRGSIMRGVSVIDASPNNDWTQVRVQVGHSNENYGRTYAVQGFIYNRPDTTGGTMLAGRSPLRVNAAQAASLGLEEVAQAPARSTRR
ncbi:CHAP domain-containing protein [Roseomonas eburnea]|uniref:CHAP domain-containing protein n=1 Tax=Neoroseomonas eburnea TaxID=1346889 RepID=A0A9X9X5K5_9PROT|nr:CHAP domain-containing protein [Neoroseomonas eburnea]MBR0678991.1 CHAP domain-containing protein [Neoroseomonas eburnea]